MQCINIGSWQSNTLTVEKHKEKLKMNEKKEYESPKINIVAKSLGVRPHEVPIK